MDLIPRHSGNGAEERTFLSFVSTNTALSARHGTGTAARFWGEIPSGWGGFRTYGRIFFEIFWYGSCELEPGLAK
jgi:hypothetical protein